MTAENLFRAIPAELPEELFSNLLQTETFRVERIVSQGHASPEGFWYDQDQNEWILLLEGAARLLIEGSERPEDLKPVDLKPGDYLNIPAHQRHRVEWTAPDIRTVWLAIHY